MLNFEKYLTVISKQTVYACKFKSVPEICTKLSNVYQKIERKFQVNNVIYTTPIISLSCKGNINFFLVLLYQKSFQNCIVLLNFSRWIYRYDFDRSAFHEPDLLRFRRWKNEIIWFVQYFLQKYFGYFL